MGWTGGKLDGPFSARAAIAFDIGDEILPRVLDAALIGSTVYAAIRTSDGREVFGLVLLTERHAGILYTKPITDDMGPAEDRCPRRILDLLTPTTEPYAIEWRQRCERRLAKPRPTRGDVVRFAQPLRFTNGDTHQTLTYQRGSRFTANGREYHVTNWRDTDYTIAEPASSDPRETQR